MGENSGSDATPTPATTRLCTQSSRSLRCMSRTLTPISIAFFRIEAAISQFAREM